MSPAPRVLLKLPNKPDLTWLTALLQPLSRLLLAANRLRVWVQADMTRIVLVMHEPLGSSFAECAEHVLGHEANLIVFDVAPDCDPEAQVDRLADLLQQKNGRAPCREREGE